jgi:nitroreductase
MDALTAIRTRASASKLAEPGPTPEQLDLILKLGIRAPDHGRLSPWRFVVIEGEARARFGQAIADIRRRRPPEPTERELEREAEKAMRAPTIVAVAAHITNPERIPPIEQILAAGAAAQNMMLAAHAMGLGAMWKTGTAAYDGELKKTLGLDEDDHIVAFLYIGTPLSFAPPRRDSPDMPVTRL